MPELHPVLASVGQAELATSERARAASVWAAAKRSWSIASATTRIAHRGLRLNGLCT